MNLNYTKINSHSGGGGGDGAYPISRRYNKLDIGV